MISLLSRHRRTLFIATIAVFLAGTFVGLGGYLLGKGGNSQAVATVGSTSIPYSRYLTRVNQYSEALRSRNQDVSDDMLKKIKVETLRDMVVEEILLIKADELGLAVTDEELARSIRAYPAFQVGGEFSPQAYRRAVYSNFRDTVQGYEDMQRRGLKTSRLRQLVYQSATLTPAELRQLYAQAHKGSLKGFEKDQKAFAPRAQQARALDLLNLIIKQVLSQVEVRTYLEQRESGA